MITLTNTSDQTVAANGTVTYNTVVTRTGNDICYRKGTGSVKMKSGGIYSVQFTANIGSTTATTAASLQLAIGGVPVENAIATVVSTAANDLNNVCITTYISNCCCDYDRISIINPGTASIIVDSPNLSVMKVA